MMDSRLRGNDEVLFPMQLNCENALSILYKMTNKKAALSLDWAAFFVPSNGAN
jgi:hypothetical protein